MTLSASLLASALAVSLTNSFVTLDIDGRGRIASIRAPLGGSLSKSRSPAFLPLLTAEKKSARRRFPAEAVRSFGISTAVPRRPFR